MAEFTPARDDRARGSVLECIALLNAARASGQLSFLAALPDEAHIDIILAAHDPTQMRRIKRFCSKLKVEHVFMPSALDLCLTEVPTEIAVTEEVIERLKELITRVSADASILGIVVSGYWGLAHYLGEGEPIQLQLGVLRPLSLEELTQSAAALSLALGFEYDLYVGQEEFTVKPENSLEQIRDNLRQNILRTTVIEMAVSLGTLANAIRAWQDGEALPHGLTVQNQEKGGALTLQYTDENMTIIYRGRR